MQACRSLAASGCACTCRNLLFRRPYLVVAILFAALGLPFALAKAVMLSHPLVSKWGALLLASALFSVAHVIVAMNVNLLARRRFQMGLIPQVFTSLSLSLLSRHRTPPDAGNAAVHESGGALAADMVFCLTNEVHAAGRGAELDATG